MSGDLEKPKRFMTAKQRALAARAKAAGFVEARAERLAAKYAGLIDKSDLISLGHVGLIEAACAYREELGGFDDFAARRVFGAMLDGVRLEARRARVERAAHRAAATALGTYRDDFNALTHTEDELRQRLQKFSDTVLASAFLGAVDEARRRGTEDEVVERDEYAGAIGALDKATSDLAPEQQRLLTLVYHEKRDLTDVATELGVSYATVRRKHDGALDRLKKLLHASGVHHAPGPRDGPWSEPPP